MRSVRTAVSLVFLCASAPLAAQEADESESAAPFSMEFKSLPAPVAPSSGSDTPPITILEKVVDRGGPLAYVGAVNRSGDSGKFIPGALICSHHAGQEERDWLFATPLWQGAESNIVAPGVNLFSLLIQGYRLEDPESMLARQHFSYILEMTQSRTLQLMESIKEPDESQSFGRLAISFMKGIYESSDADFDVDSYRAIDEVISCEISSKILAPDGSIQPASISLSSLGVAWWLSNYRWRDETKELREFEAAVEAHRP